MKNCMLNRIFRNYMRKSASKFIIHKLQITSSFSIFPFQYPLPISDHLFPVISFNNSSSMDLPTGKTI